VTPGDTLERWRSLIGTRSNPVRNRIDSTAVQSFAEAIGDPNPLFTDAQAGARSRWGTRIAPPTFAKVLDFGRIPGLDLPTQGLIHGSQAYVWQRPLAVGEEVDCHGVLVGIVEKAGREGRLLFVVLGRAGVDADGETVFTGEEVLIVTEAVLQPLEEGNP